MVILVDYDNVAEIDRTHGSQHLVSRIIDVIGIDPFQDNDRVLIRFYGGWYEGDAMTRRAQQLAADLQQAFPSPFTISTSTRRATLRLTGELAQGLAADGNAVLSDTLRREGANFQKFHQTHPPFQGCFSPGSCDLAKTLKSVSGGMCTVTGCSIALRHVLTKPGQKLVDTMLTADILHFATHGRKALAVVSSDDDMWPGIKAALLYGATVQHVQTLPGRRTPNRYAATAGRGYMQHSIR